MVRKDLRNMTQTKIVFSWEAGGIFHSQTLGYFNLSLQGGRKHHWNCFNLHFNFHDCNLQHLIRTYCIKYQNDIRWVSQNTTLYSVRCQKIDNMFRPFSIRPSSGLTWWHTQPGQQTWASMFTQRKLKKKKTSDPIYIEDISSTQISPGLNGIEHPQWDRRLHHGHTAFCTWPTIEI